MTQLRQRMIGIFDSVTSRIKRSAPTLEPSPSWRATSTDRRTNSVPSTSANINFKLLNEKNWLGLLSRPAGQP